jgi:hypothetical protein
LRIAKTCIDPDTADAFRGMAADCFDLADQLGKASAVVQQQQQIQPDEGSK